MKYSLILITALFAAHTASASCSYNVKTLELKKDKEYMLSLSPDTQKKLLDLGWVKVGATETATASVSVKSTSPLMSNSFLREIIARPKTKTIAVIEHDGIRKMFKASVSQRQKMFGPCPVGWGAATERRAHQLVEERIVQYLSQFHCK